MVTVRKLTETEKAQGFTSIVHIRPADPTIGRGGVEVVDPRTGETTGTISRIEFSRMQKGQRKFKGQLFVQAIARPEVEAKIRRREEKREERELAKIEARVEAKRIARGLPPVPLERKGAAKLLREKLEEAPPTRAKLEAEQRARIGVTLAKQLGLGIREDIPKRIQEEEAEKVIRGRFTEKAFRELIIPLGKEGVVEEKEPTKAKIKTLLIAEPERPELFPETPEVRFAERERIFKLGPALEVGFKPIEQQLVEKRLVAERVEVPEKLTTLQQLKIGAREIPFALEQAIREPKRLAKGLVEIPKQLGKDVIKLVTEAPPPTTPGFALALAEKEELRAPAIRVATVGAIIGGLTLLPPIATAVVGLGVTGLEAKRFVEEPSPEQLGRLAFVGGVSAFALRTAIRSRIAKFEAGTIIRAPVKEPIGFQLGGKRIIVAKDISQIIGVRPSVPSAVPSLRLFDLTKVVKGTGAEVLGAKVTLGAGVSSQIFVGKPEVVTGIRPPSFITRIGEVPSFIKGLVQKVPRKVSVEIIGDMGKPIPFKQALKETFRLPKEKPIEFKVSKIVGEQLVTDDLILDGKRVTRQRAIEELEPTSVGKLLREQLGTLRERPIEITKEGKLLPRIGGVELLRRITLQKGQAFAEIDLPVPAREITKDIFRLGIRGLREPSGKPFEITKVGSFRDLAIKKKPFGISVRRISLKPEKRLRGLENIILGRGLRKVGEPTSFANLQEALGVSGELFRKPEPLGITKTGRFRDILKGGPFVKAGKPISIEAFKVISKRPKALAQFDVLQRISLKEAFRPLGAKVPSITKTGRFRDLFKPPKAVREEVGLDLLTGKFKVKRILPIKKEPFIQFKIAREFEAPFELQPTPPITLVKRAGAREAFRFITQKRPPEFVTIKIPKLRIELAKRVIGPGIGVGEVSVRRLNLGLIDIRLTKFGPQRLIGTTPKPKIPELEILFRTGFLLTPEGRGVVLGEAFPSGRRLILSRGKLPSFIKIERTPLVVPQRSIIELGEPKKTIKEVEIETRGERGTQLLIQKTEQVSKSVKKQRQQQEQLLKQRIKLKKKQLLGQGKLVVLTPGLEGQRNSIGAILSGSRFDSLRGVILGQESKQKQSQKLVQQLISEQELEQFQVPISLGEFGTAQAQAQLSDVISRQEQITEQETITRPPKPLPLIPFFPKPRFPGERRKRFGIIPELTFGFTGDFIAAVRNEFAPQPRQRRFTGQERRFLVRGKRFVTPLPKKGSEGMIQLVARQLGG